MPKKILYQNEGWVMYRISSNSHCPQIVNHLLPGLSVTQVLVLLSSPRIVNLFLPGLSVTVTALEQSATFSQVLVLLSPPSNSQPPSPRSQCYCRRPRIVSHLLPGLSVTVEPSNSQPLSPRSQCYCRRSRIVSHLLPGLSVTVAALKQSATFSQVLVLLLPPLLLPPSNSQPPSLRSQCYCRRPRIVSHLIPGLSVTVAALKQSPHAHKC